MIDRLHIFTRVALPCRKRADYCQVQLRRALAQLDAGDVLMVTRLNRLSASPPSGRQALAPGFGSVLRPGLGV
jgi:hypothetical protein